MKLIQKVILPRKEMSISEMTWRIFYGVKTKGRSRLDWMLWYHSERTFCSQAMKKRNIIKLKSARREVKKVRRYKSEYVNWIKALNLRI